MINHKSVSKVVSELFGQPLTKRIVNETCSSCGEMPLTLEGKHSCKSGFLLETRDRVSSQEIEQTWEDLYLQFGLVTIEELASWLGSTEEAVTAALPRWLTVNSSGEVVEKGVSVPPPPM